VRGFIDLHSHWVANIDDGVRDTNASLELIRALHATGFDTIIATPHMRPGMFDNTADDLRSAFTATLAAISTASALPTLRLSSEHYFDDVVFDRLYRGQALPYPGNLAALVEFPNDAFPLRVADRFFDLMRRGIRPVIAHPERYRPVWNDIGVLDPLLDGGAVLLLDLGALSGKYGRGSRRAAEKLLKHGYYHAACSDAHKVNDVKDVALGITRLFAEVGDEEATFLLRDGPQEILDGNVTT
jgi:protein-tyrosine phosphatase